MLIEWVQVENCRIGLQVGKKSGFLGGKDCGGWMGWMKWMKLDWMGCFHERVGG
jgi:hypothetical protein